jgi:dTDP-4-dehydrorhamnose 3,5-epimerase
VSEVAEISYMTSEEYAPECEAGIQWDDPVLKIQWPINNPRLSGRDRNWPSFRDADNNFDFSDTSVKAQLPQTTNQL